MWKLMYLWTFNHESSRPLLQKSRFCKTAKYVPFNQKILFTEIKTLFLTALIKTHLTCRKLPLWDDNKSKSELLLCFISPFRMSCPEIVPIDKDQSHYRWMGIGLSHNKGLVCFKGLLTAASALSHNQQRVTIVFLFS